MFSRHVSRELAAYADRELGNAVEVERHIGQCALCRAEFEQVQFGMAMVEHLPSVEAPAAIWASIEAALEEKPREKPIWRWAFAAAVLLTVAGIAYWRAPVVQWDVIRLDGTPIVGAKHISGTGKIVVGEWIRTDSASRAGIKVGDIGTVEVEPNTQVRVMAAKADEHRLALARDIDPRYGAAFDRARALGVEAIAYRCVISAEEIAVAGPVPVLG